MKSGGGDLHLKLPLTFLSVNKCTNLAGCVRAGFLNLSDMYFGIYNSLLQGVGLCLVLFCNILGLYPLDTVAPSPLVAKIQNVSRYCRMSLGSGSPRRKSLM